MYVIMQVFGNCTSCHHVVDYDDILVVGITVIGFNTNLRIVCRFVLNKDKNKRNIIFVRYGMGLIIKNSVCLELEGTSRMSFIVILTCRSPLSGISNLYGRGQVLFEPLNE